MSYYMKDILKKIRILWISTNNANEEIAPLKSTSENALQFALDYSKKELNYQKQFRHNILVNKFFNMRFIKFILLKKICKNSLFL